MKGKLNYLFLFLLSCGNDHLRGYSDYHFLNMDNRSCPKLEIKFKKVSHGDFSIIQLSESDSNRKKVNNKKECSLSLELKEDDISDKVIHFKEIKIICSDNQEYCMKIYFSRKYQPVNFNVGIGKVYHLKNISTNLPDADIKTDYKDKTLYNSYSNENIIEIEY